MNQKELYEKLNEIRSAAQSLSIAAMKAMDSPENMNQFHDEDIWLNEAIFNLAEWIKENYEPKKTKEK